MVESVWDDLIGNGDAVASLRSAAMSAGSPHSSMTHGWLITGPPGSGRSNLAYAFATALLGDETTLGDQPARHQVDARTHPDLVVASTRSVIMTIDEVRALVTNAQYAPSVARYRVVVVEDADRMSERTSNVLLKALEEPHARTVWILCAPSEADLLPTVRSRLRTNRLTVPSVDEVASLLEKRDGVSREIAVRSAREAQCHVGMARRLAMSPEVRERRGAVLDAVLRVDSVSAAVQCAAYLLDVAGDDAKSVGEQHAADDRDAFLRSLGVEPGATVPAALRAQVRVFDDDQKRRATRTLRDGLDRIFVDLMSMYRDIIMIQLARGHALINDERREQLAVVAREWPPAHTLAMIDAIKRAQSRVSANVAPLLALEGMVVCAIREVMSCAA